MQGSSMSTLQDTGFEVEVALQEDIGAELDYFIFLTLLGIDDEALDFASTVLWRHLQYFPVTAEIANYLITRNNVDQLKRLWDNLEDSHIRFNAADENLLLAHIGQIVEGETETGFSWYLELSRTLRDIEESERPIPDLILEIKIILASRSFPDTSPLRVSLVKDTVRYCQLLLHRQMLEEATRLFSIACLVISEGDPDELGLDSLFEDTFKLIANVPNFFGPHQKPHESLEDDNLSVYALLAVISYLDVMAKVTENTMSNREPRNRVTSLLRMAQGLLTINFDKLPDTTPRGRCLALCESLRERLVESKSSVFPISLLVRTAGSKRFQIARAIESDNVIGHLLSESVARELGIQWNPYQTPNGSYDIVGRIEFMWRREDQEKRGPSYIEHWYITPDMLPDDAQAVVQVSPSSLLQARPSRALAPANLSQKSKLEGAERDDLKRLVEVARLRAESGESVGLHGITKDRKKDHSFAPRKADQLRGEARSVRTSTRGARAWVHSTAELEQTTTLETEAESQRISELATLQKKAESSERKAEIAEKSTSEREAQSKKGSRQPIRNEQYSTRRRTIFYPDSTA